MRLQNFSNEPSESLLDPQEVAREIINLLKQDATHGCIIEIKKK